jgi:hypothetical protein
MTSQRTISLTFDVPCAQIRAELDALLTAAAHVVDLTERGGTSLQVGGAIRTLGEVVDRLRAVSNVDGRGRPGTVGHGEVTE